MTKEKYLEAVDRCAKKSQQNANASKTFLAMGDGIIQCAVDDLDLLISDFLEIRREINNRYDAIGRWEACGSAG